MDPIPPVKPAMPTPNTPTGTLGGWFRQNVVQLVLVAAVLTVVFRFLHPLDVLLAGSGLSLIIFIHELGHFLAAKWCDVHVKTFSIGFGPALPFCSFQYGETTYKLAMIPLGGFVAMVGEGDESGDVVDATADDSVGDAVSAAEQQVNYPRSFANKPVGQRMLIISAGVIMNVILGSVCFVAAYLHGVDEVPAVVAAVEPGSAAWHAGLRPGAEIVRVGSRERPWFDDLKVDVSSTGHGEAINLSVKYGDQVRDLDVEPQRQEGALLPQLGIAPPMQLTLRYSRRDDTLPYAMGSPAAVASTGGTGFRPGDRIVAMTDPANRTAVSPIEPDWNGLPGEYFDYTRRLAALAGKPITFHVVRKGDESRAEVPVTVAPAYHHDLGVRMRMGRVTAVRGGSDAESKVQIRQTHGEEVVAPGDQIVAVELPETEGPPTKFATDRADPTVKPLDPLRLPFELNRWADRNPNARVVKLTVLREVEHTQKPTVLELAWDPAYRNDGAILANPGSPVSVGGLGIAYQVSTVVDTVASGSSAATAGLRPNDKIVAVRFKRSGADGQVSEGSLQDVLPHQWAFVDNAVQSTHPHAIDARVERGSETLEVSLAGVPDMSWPIAERGLEMMPETRLQVADGIGEALRMGMHRTVRSVRMIYLGLYSMAFGRISVKMMSGPLTLAQASYLIAGRDVWYLLLWMGLISINLAVVNFLPIPVLDGGHMMFLLYEGIRGKPAPVAVQVILTYVGLATILGLMLFVIGLDVWRLFFR